MGKFIFVTKDGFQNFIDNLKLLQNLETLSLNFENNNISKFDIKLLKQFFRSFKYLKFFQITINN